MKVSKEIVIPALIGVAIFVAVVLAVEGALALWHIIDNVLNGRSSWAVH